MTRTSSGGGERPGRRVWDELGVRRRHCPRERVRTFHDGLLASSAPPRRTICRESYDSVVRWNWH
jgi:hypothetical protein